MGNKHRYSAISRANGLGREKYDIDDCRTPQGIFDEINKMYSFTLDVCASSQNTKCERYYNKEADGLNQLWTGVVWMSPPFSNKQTPLWLKKAIKETENNPDLIVWAFVRDGNTRWLEYTLQSSMIMEYCKVMPEVRFDNPRNVNIRHPMCLLRFGGEGLYLYSELCKSKRGGPNWIDSEYRITGVGRGRRRRARRQRSRRQSRKLRLSKIDKSPNKELYITRLKEGMSYPALEKLAKSNGENISHQSFFRYYHKHYDKIMNSNPTFIY